MRTISAVSGVVLGARTAATDPRLHAKDPTTGGGDTGSVLISPYIRPGSVSTSYYNHYSWLRTIEDPFAVRRVSRGLDRAGHHLGNAAQRGLAPFGSDVFNHPRGRSASRRSARGGIPRWLQKHTARLHRVVQATLRRPALAIQGDTVAVESAHGRALETVVGPSLPNLGRGALTAMSSCMFVIRLRATSGVVSIGAPQFAAADEQNHLHRLQVTRLGGGAIPRHVAAGQTVSLLVHGVLPVGNGRLKWTPDRGRTRAGWDFDVEVD